MGRWASGGASQPFFFFFLHWLCGAAGVAALEAAALRKWRRALKAAAAAAPVSSTGVRWAARGAIGRGDPWGADPSPAATGSPPLCYGS